MTDFRDEIFAEIEEAINNGLNFLTVGFDKIDKLETDLEEAYEEIEAMVWKKYRRLISFEAFDEGSECCFIDPKKPDNDQLWEDWKINVNQTLSKVKETSQSLRVNDPEPMILPHFVWLLKRTTDEKLLPEDYDIDQTGSIFKT